VVTAVALGRRHLVDRVRQRRRADEGEVDAQHPCVRIPESDADDRDLRRLLAGREPPKVEFG